MTNAAKAVNTINNDEVEYMTAEELLPEACQQPRRSNSKNPAYIVVYATDLFGIPELDPKLMVPVYTKKTPFRASLNKDYIPNALILEQVIKLLISKCMDLSLCLKGESGSGKTEMAMYISHMMNWPLTIKQINSNIRADELEGERSLIDGNTGFVHSDLVKGFRDGHLILLDEVDKIDPDTAAKLHMPIERKPWSLSANGGEVIMANEFTRFIGTANTNMTGGSRRFVSSQRQDAAFIKRFAIVEMERPTEVALTNVLTKRFDDLSMVVIQKFVSVAKSVNDSGNEDSVMDMRQLVSWVATSKTLSNMTLLETFKIAFVSALPEHIQDTVFQAMDLVLGDDKDRTLEFFTAKK